MPLRNVFTALGKPGELFIYVLIHAAAVVLEMEPSS
jgi:hypothetical protein